jgi:hypothetical protein
VPPIGGKIDHSVAGPDLAATRSGPAWSTNASYSSRPSSWGGKQSLPDDVRVELELLAERRFGSGMMYLRYRVKT